MCVLPLKGEAHSIKIKTVNQGISVDDPTSETYWFVDIDDENEIKFFASTQNEPLVVLHVSDDDFVQKVQTRHSENWHTRKLINAPIVLSEGHPIPYDWIAPFNDEIVETVIRKRSGNTVFRKSVRRTTRFISAEEAMELQMLKDGLYTLPGEARLKLISIESENHQLLVRQLWCETDTSWWIFEETPNRRSWRIP